MVKDAQSHAADDQKRREVIDLRNQADSLAYSVEKTLNENREKLSAADASRIEALVTEVRQAGKSENLDAIKRSMDALQHASHAMAEQLYKGSSHGPQGSRGPSGSQGSTGPEVKDAEVVDGEYAETR